MSKLILGIIAVVALQLAFFAYMSSDGELKTAPAVARSVLPEQKPVPEHSINLPNLSLTPSLMVPRVRNDSRKVTRSRTTTRSRENMVARSRPVFDTASVTLASIRRQPGTRGVVRRAQPESRLIPAGHTMMLVDRLPNTPRKEVTAIRKQKKRSYLERTLPVLVRKPWNFIKSVASKLD